MVEEKQNKQVEEQEGDEQSEADENDQEVTEETIVEALRECYDPEIPVNIYDLGLIYDISFPEEGVVDITMTLTAPGCGFGPQIKAQVTNRLESIAGVEQADVEIVHEPRWDKSKVTEEGQEQLAMMGF